MIAEQNAFGVWKSGEVGPVQAVFRSAKKAYCRMVTAGGAWHMAACNWKEAVGEIRAQVYRRDEGRCVACGALVTPEQMHMDERQSKGRGGEVSLANCETRCSACHIGPRGKHGDRVPKGIRTLPLITTDAYFSENEKAGSEKD